MKQAEIEVEVVHVEKCGFFNTYIMGCPYIAKLKLNNGDITDFGISERDRFSGKFNIGSRLKATVYSADGNQWFFTQQDAQNSYDTN